MGHMLKANQRRGGVWGMFILPEVLSPVLGFLFASVFLLFTQWVVLLATILDSFFRSNYLNITMSMDSGFGRGPQHPRALCGCSSL